LNPAPSSCGSSSSRRKNGNPTRISDGGDTRKEALVNNGAKKELGEGVHNEEEEREGTPTVEGTNGLEASHQGVVEPTQAAQQTPPSHPFGPLFALPFASGADFTSEEQRRLYAQLMQQAQGGQAQLQHNQQLDIQRNLVRLG